MVFVRQTKTLVRKSTACVRETTRGSVGRAATGSSPVPSTPGRFEEAIRHWQVVQQGSSVRQTMGEWVRSPPGCQATVSETPAY
jgi:hypothetical protein